MTKDGEVVKMVGGLAFHEDKATVEEWADNWEANLRDRVKFKRVRISFENGLEVIG